MRVLLSGLVLAAFCLMATPSAHAADEKGAETGAEIAGSLASNLKSSGQLEDYHISVKFNKGTAWLIGSVTDSSQEQAAIGIAEDTEGVTRVISKLIIGSGSKQSELRQPAANRDLPTRMAAPLSRGTVRKDSRVRPVSQEAPAPAQMRQAPPMRRTASNMPMPYGRIQRASHGQMMQGQMMQGQMMQGHTPSARGAAQARFDQPQMPGYAWPSYAAHPNYAAVTYPKQYSPTAWPFIGPFYPYPQVPLGWRKVTLEWDDGWWMLDFKDH